MKKSEAGQGLVEYALILVLVSITVVAVLSLLGPRIGNTFSAIECGLSFGGEPPLCNENGEEIANSWSNSLHQTELTAQPEENEALLVQLETLKSAAIDQEERLHDAFSQFSLGLNDSVALLIAQARASGDDVLTQTLLALQQELQVGNYDSLPDALTTLNTALANAPFETQIAVVEAIVDSSLDACKEMADAVVSPDLYQATVEALNEQETQAPGSTGPAIPLLQGAWNEIIEPRNQAAMDGEAGMATLLTLLIAGLEATDEAELLQLAQHLNDQGDGCGTLPNSPPVVKTGPDRTAQVNRSVTVSGRWKDPAGHLDEPYAWAWDLDGDGVWESEGISAYGPALVERVSFTEPGIYTLSLMVTDKDGDSDMNTLLVTVKE